MLKSFLKLLNDNNVKYTEHARLDNITYMRTGGLARVLAYPSDANALAFIARLAYQNGISYRVIGRMSNTLPGDGEFGGIVIDTRLISGSLITDEYIKAECGARLSRVIWQGAKRGYSGLEELFMIPASIGGAVYNNAGAHGKTISDVLIDAEVYSVEDDVFKTLNREELDFGYRHSRFMDERIILLSARFRVNSSEYEEIKSKIEAFVAERRKNQPIEYPSLGSVFKRSGGQGAGYYIERAGLKGYRIGGAEVSTKHAGFIINRDKATSKDVLSLIEYIKTRVHEVYGITLEEEIEIL